MDKSRETFVEGSMNCTKNNFILKIMKFCMSGYPKISVFPKMMSLHVLRLFLESLLDKQETPYGISLDEINV